MKADIDVADFEELDAAGFLALICLSELQYHLTKRHPHNRMRFRVDGAFSGCYARKDDARETPSSLAARVREGAASSMAPRAPLA